uniref:CSON007914 protein n=1 Tax=Culicoides sonorensis TaxID=179676 RepID=A0A336KTQ7_CULSO
MMTTLAPKKGIQLETRTTQPTKYSDISNNNLIIENNKNFVDSAKNSDKIKNNNYIYENKGSESSSKSNVISISESVDESLLDLYNTPMYFGTENSSVVTVQAGAVAHLPCTIHHIGEGVVSWLRRKDETYHLLTVALTTYSSDERFTTIHLSHSEDWTLQIKFVQVRDSGIYECQVSTHPPSSIFIHLNVVGK